MPLFEATVPVRYIRPLVAWVDDVLPGGADVLLTACGLLRDDLAQANGQVLVGQLDALFQQAGQLLGRGDIGYVLGQRVGIDQHGALALALRRCTTLDELFRVAARYYRLITPAFTARYTRRPSHGEYIVCVTAPMSRATLRHALELHAVSCHLDLARMLGPEADYDVFLSMPKPRHHGLYRNLRPARFHFHPAERPEMRCVVDAQWLDRPLPFARAPAPGGSRQDLDAALRAFHPSSRYADWVVLMLREAEAVQPSLVELAGLLDIGPRTLTRKLSEEGQDFRVLANRVRHERACALLADERQSLWQIAYSLGYSSTANFITAFRKMGGTTPARFRRALVSARAGA